MRFARLLARTVVATSLLVACAGAPARTRASTPPRAQTAHAPVAPREPAPANAVVAPPRAPGPLNRAEVEALLAEGLGRVLARVELSPVVQHGRFVGFRLEGAQDLAAWQAAGADIRLGDVILRVNGVRIERPEQAQWAFERLRIATAIEVDVLRGSERVAIRSPILPDGTSPP